MNPASTANINLAELLVRVDNDRDLLRDLLSIFKEEFPSYLRSLQQAVARTDATEIARVSHALKGMFANLAALKAAASASRLEQLARSGETPSLKTAFAEFERDLHGLLPEIDAYLAEVHL